VIETVVDWNYYNPVEIHFGAGIIDNLSNFVSDNAVLVTSPGTSRRGISEKIRKLIGDSLIALYDKVEPNPTFKTIKTTYRELKQVEYDLIIAVGGGSVIDTAKAVAAISGLDNEESLRKILKNDVEIQKKFNPKPVIAIPTTAGTGSEVTMWATIWDMKEKKKYSLSHPKLYPIKALLDPELVLTLPERETIYSGLDALSHAMEAIWNKYHNPVSDTLALKAISLIYNYLPELKNDLNEIRLRNHLLKASLLAGLAFSNTKTAIAHSISYPLTALFGLPHGLACALSLPHILKMFRANLNSNEESEERKALSEITKRVSEHELEGFFDELGIFLNLKNYGISITDLKLVMDDCYTPERANNFIFEISQEDIKRIVLNMYG